MSQPTLCLKSYLPFFDNHLHGFDQSVLPVSGSLELEIGDASGQFFERHAALIYGFKSHAFEASGENQFIVADIPKALVPVFDSLPAFNQLDDNINHYIQFLQR
jgi:hypothetical protein